MIRFAYPNVSQERFIGCGHYLSLPAGQEPPPGYTEAQPQHLNQAEVEAAAACLVPELNESEAGVCGPCDERSQGFGGRSQAFAYLLARIGGVRHLRAECLPPAQNIWCTGAISLPDGARSPLLEAVFDHAFVPKLHAFLAASDPRLFLVPAANLTANLRRLCNQAGAQWLSLSQFRRKRHPSASAVGPPKTVITIARDELPLLVDTLFVDVRKKGLGRVSRLGIGALLGLLMLLPVGDGVPTMLQSGSKSASPPVEEPGATRPPPTPPPSPALSGKLSPKTPHGSPRREFNWYFLQISFDPRVRLDILSDPFKAAPFVKKLESLPGGTDLRERGVWGPGPIYNLGSWDWVYVVLTFDEVVPPLVQYLRRLPEIAEVKLQRFTENDRVEMENYLRKSDAAQRLYGDTEPKSEFLPKTIPPSHLTGFRMW